jgi:hypothetical protein
MTGAVNGSDSTPAASTTTTTEPGAADTTGGSTPVTQDDSTPSAPVPTTTDSETTDTGTTDPGTGSTDGSQTSETDVSDPTTADPDTTAEEMTTTETSEPSDPDTVPSDPAESEPGNPTSTASCSFTIDAELSPAIATVGIVNWSTDLPGITAARIEFGLESAGPTMVAPVEAPGADNRTLLLGMKGDQSYVYTIVAEAGAEVCTSEQQVIETGPVSNSVSPLNIDVRMPDAVTPGFMTLSEGVGNLGGPGGGGSGSMVYIVDQDGDPVWWAEAPASTSRARMDWEGNNMWMISVNVQNGNAADVRRVSMDGMDVEMNVEGLSDCHHDLAVVPGGIVTCMSWISGGNDPPSDLIERHPDGSIDVITTLDSNIYVSNSYHSNSITYHPSDDTYTISDRNPNLYVKLSRQGELIWQLGGNNPVGASFSGETQWAVNHGHHLTDEGTFLIFNNNGEGGGGGGGFGGGGPSPVIEFQLDEATMTATRVWEYTSGESSPTLGDVQRLPNGNTLITYSNAGTIHEVDPSGNVVQTITSSGSFGYTMHRPSLYGPAPK